TDRTIRYTSTDSLGSWAVVPGNGVTTSGPGAALFNNGDLVVAHRGTDDNLYFNTWRNGSWASSWTRDPGGGKTAHAPSLAGVLTNANDEITVAVQGEDDAPWIETLMGRYTIATTWDRWTDGQGGVSKTAHPVGLMIPSDDFGVGIVLTSEQDTHIYATQ